jgi:hypothetical protein
MRYDHKGDRLLFQNLTHPSAAQKMLLKTFNSEKIEVAFFVSDCMVLL